MIETLIASVAVTTIVLVIAVVGLDVYIRNLVRQAMEHRCQECNAENCTARLVKSEFLKSKMSIQM